MGNCLATSSIQHQSISTPAKSLPLAECAPSTKRSYKANELVAEEWVKNLDSHSVARLAELATPTCKIIFKGDGDDADAEMPVDQFFECFEQIVESFPNIRFTWDSVKEDGPSGTVIVQNLQAKGTHTGKPYGFGPYPPIAAANIEVADPPIKVTFTIQDGKVEKYVCDAFGKLSGPPVFYTKIGGMLF